MSLLRRLTGGSGELTGEQEERLRRHHERGDAVVERLVREDADDRAEPPDLLVSAAVAAFDVVQPAPGWESYHWFMLRRDLVTRLVRRKLPWALADVELMFALARRLGRRTPQFDWALLEALGPAISAADRYVRDHGVDSLRPLLGDALREVERIDRSGWEREVNRVRGRLRKLLEQGRGPTLDLSLVEPDDWGKAVRAELARQDAAGPLLAHLATATSARPGAAWARRAAELVQGQEEVVRLLLAEALRTEPRVVRSFVFEGREYREHHWLTDANANLVRGAVWTLATLRPAWAFELLEPLVSRGVAHGTKVANAGVYALGELATPEAVGVLSTLHVAVKDRGFQKRVQAALDAAAAQLGVSPTQLLERVVPTHGLDAEGRRELAVAGWTAVLQVGPARVVTRWRGPGGEEQKTTPAALKDEPALAEVKAAAKELRKALATERSRLEGLLAEDAVWTFEDWRASYRDHPLVGVLARRLYWRFDGEIALGEEAPAAAKEVRLWHPARAPSEEVEALRRSLVERELAQPFKQAYREIYLLAPAERETRVYSNRFAAHVLHYPQTYALLKERGWGGNALGWWDGGYDTAVFREFRGAGLRAEWYLQNVDTDWNGGAVASLATTDQVRFVPLRPRDADPVPLEQVPPLVFSEAMRDVDLFVGVSSVGADPTWADAGPDAHRRYWLEFSFGALDESAEIRREVLAGLIPKLRIADRLDLGDRYLRVRGELRTYRIHLRSANIQMEPNDEYLCIVPAPAAERPTSKVFLPFEDDRRLNVILSKAFLLANDRKIDDPTITQQISRRR